MFLYPLKYPWVISSPIWHVRVIDHWVHTQPWALNFIISTAFSQFINLYTTPSGRTELQKFLLKVKNVHKIPTGNSILFSGKDTCVLNLSSMRNYPVTVFDKAWGSEWGNLDQCGFCYSTPRPQKEMRDMAPVGGHLRTCGQLWPISHIWRSLLVILRWLIKEVMP